MRLFSLVTSIFARGTIKTISSPKHDIESPSAHVNGILNLNQEAELNELDENDRRQRLIS